MDVSKEDWEIPEGHEDQLNEVTKVPQPLTSPVLSNNRTPERCPVPALPQDCSEGNPNVLLGIQDVDLTHINDTFVSDDESLKNKILTESILDDDTRSSEEQHTSLFFKSDDINITQDIPTSFHSEELPSDPCKQVLSSDSSQTLPGIKPFLSSKYEEGLSTIESQKIPTKEEIFSCSACGKKFINKTNLVEQKKIQILENLYLCLECEKRFTNQSNPVTQQTTDTEVKLYSCSECGRWFLYKSHLIIHQRVHTREKPYSCSECGQCFSHQITLVRHLRIHTGEKPYPCLECGKCFSRKSTLVNHEKIHTRGNVRDVS